MAVTTIKPMVLKFKNSTTPADRVKYIQNSNIPSLKKVAVATMIVTTWLVSGALAEEKRAFATSRRNKSQGVARKLHIWTRKNGTGKDAIGKPSWLSVVATMKIAINEKVVWSLPTTSKDAGKHKGPGNWTYHEAKDPVTGQAEGTETPNTAEDSAKHATLSCTNHHKAKHLIQTHLKNEEEKIWTFSCITCNHWNGGRLIK